MAELPHELTVLDSENEEDFETTVMIPLHSELFREAYLKKLEENIIEPPPKKPVF